MSFDTSFAKCSSCGESDCECDETIDVECPKCGGKFTGWPEQKDTLCLECYAEKEICNVTE
jgi:hypothetical protein